MSRAAAFFFASVACLGKIPGAPGTYGSLAAALGYWLVTLRFGLIRPELHLSVIGLVTILGAMASDRVGRELGCHDPQLIIVDEVAGQLLTFWMLPAGWFPILAGVVLFRTFDIWKPFPIRRVEKLPRGIGVMADDLLAGVYANVILQIVHRVWN